MTSAGSARLWAQGAATGLGSMPGTDPVEAMRVVLGELDVAPHLVELPARGPGADMVGRTAAMLVDFPLEWQAHGWTVTSASGRDVGRARDFLRWDLDALTEQAQGVEVVKIQVCGPLTLAAAVELPSLHKLITDHGALREITASLVQGVTEHVAEVTRRLPGTRVVLQVDEPSLPAVLGGRVPTPSGYGTVRSLEPAVVQPLLADVLAVVEPGHRIVHCCAPNAPITLMRGAGADAVALDRTLITTPEFDQLGELIDGGGQLLLGIAPSTDLGDDPAARQAMSVTALRNDVLSLWARFGFSVDELAAVVTVTPACGLAGASTRYARQVMHRLAEVGRSLRQD